MKRALAIASLLALSACGGEHEFSGAVSDPPQVVQDFTLTDQYGEPFRFGADTADVSIVFFGYTLCPDVCPTTLADLVRVKRALGAEGVARPGKQFARGGPIPVRAVALAIHVAANVAATGRPTRENNRHRGVRQLPNLPDGMAQAPLNAAAGQARMPGSGATQLFRHVHLGQIQRNAWRSLEISSVQRTVGPPDGRQRFGQRHGAGLGRPPGCIPGKTILPGARLKNFSCGDNLEKG